MQPFSGMRELLGTMYCALGCMRGPNVEEWSEEDEEEETISCPLLSG